MRRTPISSGMPRIVGTAMRRKLITVAALAGLWAGAACAQVQVQDSASLFQQVKAYAQELRQYATALQSLQQQVQTAEQTLQIVQSTIQNPSLGAVMGLANRAGLGSALPINPYSVQGLVSGSGGLSSRLGSISTLSNSSFGANTIYQCQDQSFACLQQRQTAVALAGQQGIGMASIQSLADHQLVLQGVRDRLATSNTPAERENALGLIQTESLWTQQESARLTAVSVLMQSQRDIRVQQADEKLKQGFDETADRYHRAIAAGG